VQLAPAGLRTFESRFSSSRPWWSSRWPRSRQSASTSSRGITRSSRPAGDCGLGSSRGRHDLPGRRSVRHRPGHWAFRWNAPRDPGSRRRVSATGVLSNAIV